MFSASFVACCSGPTPQNHTKRHLVVKKFVRNGAYRRGPPNRLDESALCHGSSAPSSAKNWTLYASMVRRSRLIGRGCRNVGCALSAKLRAASSTSLLNFFCVLGLTDGLLRGSTPIALTFRKATYNDVSKGNRLSAHS
jgi:hypothetical protein